MDESHKPKEKSQTRGKIQFYELFSIGKFIEIQSRLEVPRTEGKATYSLVDRASFQDGVL